MWRSGNAAYVNDKCCKLSDVKIVRTALFNFSPAFKSWLKKCFGVILEHFLVVYREVIIDKPRNSSYGKSAILTPVISRITDLLPFCFCTGNMQCLIIVVWYCKTIVLNSKLLLIHNLIHFWPLCKCRFD